jgi:dTDP-4-amino-4,6-dideoxygalactose transaminase
LVPLFDTKAQHQAIEPELMAAFQRVLRSGHFILGPEVQGFEKTMAEFLGVRHAVGVSSGTDAILLALMTLGIGPGDEVICPSFTFFATAGCIARTGAKPVFVDCCPVCFNLDVADVARKITARTKAVIPVHLFGQSADMDAVMALAREHKLAVIEDAAQSLGAEFRSRKVGTIGAFGTFSFFPTKNLGALGDAGLLVTNDDALGERARLLRTHGAKQKYYHQLVGANFRLDALQAALLSVKLPHYATYTTERRENAAFYTDQLSKLPGVITADPGASTCTVARPTGADGKASASPISSFINHTSSLNLILPVAYPHNAHIWNQYTVRVPGPGRRDALRQYLAERGIGAEIYYPVPLHRQQCFAPANGPAPALPVCETIASQCLSLPIYPELTRDQLLEVASAIASFS